MAEAVEFSLSDYNRIIYRQFRFIFIVVVIMTCIGLLVGYRMPRLYKVTGVVEADFDVFFEGVDVNPALTSDLIENLSVMAVDITSYTVLLRVAQRLGAVSDTVSTENILTNTEVLNQIEAYRERLKLQQLPAEKRIALSVISRDPVEAQKLVHAVCETYRDYSLEKKRKHFKNKKSKIQDALDLCNTELGEIADRTVEIRKLQKGLINEEYLKKQKKKLRDIRRDQQKYRYIQTIAELQLQECERISNFLISESENIKNSTRQELLLADISYLGELKKQDRGLEPLHRRLTRLLSGRKEQLQYYTILHPNVRDLYNRLLATLDEVSVSLKRIRKNAAETEKKLEVRYGTTDQLLKRKHVDDYMLNWLKVKYTSQEEICESIEAKLAELQVSEGALVPYITIVKEPEIPPHPQGLGTVKTGIAGMAAGLLLAVVFAFIREIADTSFHTIEDVQRAMGGHRVLAVIPVMTKRKKVLRSRYDSRSIFREYYHELLPLFFSRLSSSAEAYKILATRQLTGKVEGKAQIIQITSTREQEGKTVVAANLAIALAQLGENVLLLEANFRNPALAPLFGLSASQGLAQILIEEQTMERCRITVSDVVMGSYSREDLVKIHGINNLDIVLHGSLPPNPSELLSSTAMKALMELLQKEYDYVIVDSPPLTRITDSAVLSRYCDCVMVVYRSGMVPRKLFISNVEKVAAGGAIVEGLILNRWIDENLTG